MAQSAAQGASEEDRVRRRRRKTVLRDLHGAGTFDDPGNRSPADVWDELYFRNYPSIRITSAGWGTKTQHTQCGRGSTTSGERYRQLGLEV